MAKPIHEMSQWDASVHNSRVPEEEWQATRELTQVATQILGNRETYDPFFKISVGVNWRF